MGHRAPALQLSALILLAVLSGCAGSNSGPAGTSTAAPSDEQHVGRGIIAGRVLDDEFRPLAGATVTVLPDWAVSVTDATGTFDLRNVPAGRRYVSAAHPGYATSTERVDLAGEARLEIEFQLTPLRVSAAAYEALHHAAYHSVGQGDLNALLNLAGVPLGCEGCVWNVTAREPPSHVLIEVAGQHAVPHPGGRDVENVTVVDRSTGSAIRQADVPLGGRVNFTKAQLNRAHDLQLRFLCDPDWFCHEERREVWVTLFYGMDIPEGYTALPPPE